VSDEWGGIHDEKVKDREQSLEEYHKKKYAEKISLDMQRTDDGRLKPDKTEPWVPNQHELGLYLYSRPMISNGVVYLKSFKSMAYSFIYVVGLFTKLTKHN